jgi:hypothetical protein
VRIPRSVDRSMSLLSLICLLLKGPGLVRGQAIGRSPSEISRGKIGDDCFVPTSLQLVPLPVQSKRLKKDCRL